MARQFGCQRFHPQVAQQGKNNNYQLVILERLLEFAVNYTREGARHTAAGAAHAEDAPDQAQ